MTREEIKESITMKEVLSRYGIQVNRNNMCSCPFHGKDRHPSMQIFKDGFKCYTCNANGDIFKFVQMMDNCSFKQAFISLGGTYKKQETKRQQASVKANFKREKEKRMRKANYKADFKLMLSEAITKCRNIIASEEPYSDKWCKAQNSYPYLLYVWELKYVNEEEINEADVIRNCRRIKSI